METVRIERTGPSFGELQKMDRVVREICVKNMNDASERGMRAIEDLWKTLAPVQSGAYKASIHSRTESRGDTVVGSVQSNVDYATFVESGTGLHRHGSSRTTRRLITARPGTPFVFYSGSFRGGSGSGGRKIVTMRTRGQRAQWVARRARIGSKPYVDSIFRVSAAQTKREILAAIRNVRSVR